MRIEPDHFLTKAFFWSEGLKAEFRQTWFDTEYPPKGTNLCYFVRSLTINLLFIFTMQLLSVVMPIIALVVVPIKIWGTHQWWKAFVWMGWAGVIAAAICIVIAIWSFVENLWNNRSQISKPQNTVFRVGEEIVRSIDEKICPLIEFKFDFEEDEDEDDNDENS